MNLVALQTVEGEDMWIYPGNVFMIQPAFLWQGDDYTMVGSFVSFTDSTGRHANRIRVPMMPGEVVEVLHP
jgi:hypothetical protein